ncbi:MAG TPA: hypothetical protein VH044_14835 [Polyangiaceae bacterium]|jgi:hypothetical protein|nr:hypothetical protein [Polyangiaceae bacterium]
MLQRLLTLVAFAPVVLWSRGASAAASAHLVYVRGPRAGECPSEASVRGAVSARLGYDPFFLWAHDTLFVEVTGARGAFRVELKLVDDQNLQRGTREITVKTGECAGVLDAMALTMSLAIDPSSVVGAPSSATPPSAPVDPVALPTPASLPEAPSAPDSPHDVVADAGPRAMLSAPDSRANTTPPEVRRVHARVGVRATGSAGAALAANAGAAAFVGVRWRALSLDLEGRFDLPATGPARPSDARVTSWIVAASLVPCAHLGPLFGCAVGSIGSQTASWHVTARSVWDAAGGRVGAELPLFPSWTLDAYGELLGTVPNKIAVGTASYPLPALSGGLAIGVGYRFL